jgi:hypothetical protein
MEILLQQRFVSAKIDLIRDYCKLEDKSLYDGSWGLFSEYPKKFVPLDLIKRDGRGSNAKFFSHKLKTTEDTRHNTMFEHVGVFETQSDRHIKQHYNNPFAQVKVSILERSIIKRGNKVSIKSMLYSKTRQFNHRFFKTLTEKTIFTFDFDTGNFQVITFQGGKKTKGIFRTNSFTQLQVALKYTPSIFDMDNYEGFSKPEHKFNEQYKKAINNKEHQRVITKVFGLEPYHLSKKENYRSFYEKMVEMFVKYKKIGVPDHSYEHFLTYHYPTERLLKKNERKLISSVLDRYNIKSKLLVKIFHKYPFVDITAMIKLCIMLGENHTKHIGSLPDELFSISQHVTDDVVHAEFYQTFAARVLNFNIRETEKENLIKLLSDKKNLKALTSQYLEEIYDHFNMIDKIRKYDTDLIFKAKSYPEFRDEHLQLSKMITAIKKGWVTQYVFEEKTVMEIEHPVTYLEQTYHPIILKREEEYVEEGAFMHHCVASYVDHDKSIIVSIRNEDSSDRLTCEFNIQTGKLVQARHFCNRPVPEEFEEALNVVQDKIRLHARFGTLNWKEKKKVACKINGVEVVVEKPRTASELYPRLFN